MTTWIVAIETYGSQRVKDPRTGRQVSSYKMGYTSAAPDTLLAIYGSQARDVSSRRASYRYIKLEGETTVRHGYLLMKLTAEELARAVHVTRQYDRAAVYVWRDRQWCELPTRRTADYTPISGRSGPTFDPTGYRAVSPSSGEKEAAVMGIQVDKSQRNPDEKPWFWLSGDTYPHRETLRRYGARFSQRRKAWYYIGAELPAAIQALVTAVGKQDTPSDHELDELLSAIQDSVDLTDASDNESAPSEAVSPAMPPDPVVEPPTEETPRIRVLKPQALSDEMQQAIQQAKNERVLPGKTLQPRVTRKTLVSIGQSCVGELTGSITGQVYCFGFAIHEGICVYVNMGGPRMAVEAIRAKLGRGEIVTLVPWDAPAIELTAGEGSSGMYTDYLQNIPEAKFTSLILIHEWLIQPNYGGSSTTFIIRTSDEQAMAKLKHHITALVKVPVFEAWASYLYSAGQAAMLVRKTRAGGGIDLLTVTLDADAWTRLITGGGEAQVIKLP
jgi:hypothetical protein